MINEKKLEILRNLLASGEWVSGRVIQSNIHRLTGDPTYKAEMGILRRNPGVDFEDRMAGTSHHYFYRLRPSIAQSLSVWDGAD